MLDRRFVLFFGEEDDGLKKSVIMSKIPGEEGELFSVSSVSSFLLVDLLVGETGVAVVVFSELEDFIRDFRAVGLTLAPLRSLSASTARDFDGIIPPVVVALPGLRSPVQSVWDSGGSGGSGGVGIEAFEFNRRF